MNLSRVAFKLFDERRALLHDPQTIVNELLIPGKDRVRDCLRIFLHLQELIALSQDMVILLQVMKIHRIHLRQLHIHEFSAVLRAVFDKRQILRGKYDNMKTPDQLASLRGITVDKDRLVPAFFEMDLYFLFFSAHFIDDPNQRFLRPEADTLFIVGGTV